MTNSIDDSRFTVGEIPKVTLTIIGNGPSRDLYKGLAHGPVMVCNIPQIEYRYDGILIIDRRPFDWMKQNAYKPSRPIYTLESNKKWTVNFDLEQVYTVFETKLMNVAQTAALHFAQQFYKIRFYGCDSMWTDILESKQDEIIHRGKRNPSLKNRWMDKWKPVFELENNEFEFVCPKGVETPDFGKNVRFVHE